MAKTYNQALDTILQRYMSYPRDERIKLEKIGEIRKDQNPELFRQMEDLAQQIDQEARNIEWTARQDNQIQAKPAVPIRQPRSGFENLCQQGWRLVDVIDLLRQEGWTVEEIQVAALKYIRDNYN